MQETLQQYREQLADCRKVFIQKNSDYGTAWRILRPASLTDQIFIKAQRIRTIGEKGQQQINDKLHDEWVGIVNYCIMALIQLDLPPDSPIAIALPEAIALYDAQAAEGEALMQRKNHDYGEAWRDMRISSLNDLILMKIFRLKQIEDNRGKTIASEGLAANYLDILNYAIFALIKMA